MRIACMRSGEHMAVAKLRQFACYIVRNVLAAYVVDFVAGLVVDKHTGVLLTPSSNGFHISTILKHWRCEDRPVPPVGVTRLVQRLGNRSVIAVSHPDRDFAHLGCAAQPSGGGLVCFCRLREVGSGLVNVEEGLARIDSARA